MPSTRLILLIVAGALLGAVTPAVAFQPLPGAGAVATPTDTPAGADNASAVDVTPGAQLSTVLAATAVTTRSEIEDVRFELKLERSDDDERAAALTERAEALAERAASIREDYETATATRESGDLTAEQYARRLAELNARAEDLLDDIDALRAQARTASGLELEAAGFNRTALRAAAADVDPLTGVGPSAILQRFLGESTGEVEFTTDAGLRVEIEGEAGERSLEVKRDRDDDDSIRIAQDTALSTARETLPPGRWTLERASVHPDDGYYKFEFALDARNRTGEAEVRVDGSSGEVFRLEVETEAIDGADAEEDVDDGEADDDRELTLLLADGTPAPNATVTVRALEDGEPAANVTVSVNDVAMAETDAAGEATVTLPRASEVTVRTGDVELEFEFDEAVHARDEVFRQLGATATLAGGVVTVSVTFDGEPVTDATVFANDRRVGEAGADGTVSFEIDVNATDELELELVKGEFEAELEFDVTDAGLSLTEASHEGDGDKVEDEAEDDDADADETDTPEEEDDEDDGETDTPEGDDEDDEDDEERDTPEEDDDDGDSSGSG